jgi:hypothetical protein
MTEENIPEVSDAELIGMINWILEACPQDQEAALLLAMKDPNNVLQAYRWILSQEKH